MPLIDNRQFKHDNEGIKEIIKVVFAIVSTIEDAVVECRIATELEARVRLVVTMKVYQTLKYLHTNNSKCIVQNLKQNTQNNSPVATWRLYNIALTSIQRHYVYITSY